MIKEKRNLICIVCPAGCPIEVLMADNKVESVSGHTCKRGEEYARAECIHPVRTLTSTVRLLDGLIPMAPVKSDHPLPKHMILDCMKEINQCRLQAPVRAGDVVIQNILNTGIHIIATRSIPKYVKRCRIKIT
jgi:CxxC motif-containing protein